MPTLTNISGMRRALPLINKRYVEFVPGESKDFPDADWAAIKGRISVNGHFRVEGVAPPSEKDPAPKAPKAAKAAEPAKA